MKFWLFAFLLLPNFAFAQTTIIDHTAVAWNVAISVGIEPSKFLDLIRCESGLDGLQGKPVWGDKGKSYGILQYQQPTFNSHSKDYGITGVREDYITQIVLGARAIADGKTYAWYTCGKSSGLLPKNWTFAMLK